MKRIAGTIIISLILAGCSTLPFRGFGNESTDGLRNRLDAASSALAKGNSQKAASLLGEVCARSSVTGVTDEALFRLALLKLSEDEPAGYEESRQLLARLKTEFPRSQWTTLSSPLAGLLNELEGLENENLRLANRYRELQNIKGLNQSLIRQNRDLQQTLNRLKAADLELERKSR